MQLATVANSDNTQWHHCYGLIFGATMCAHPYLLWAIWYAVTPHLCNDWAHPQHIDICQLTIKLCNLCRVVPIVDNASVKGSCHLHHKLAKHYTCVVFTHLVSLCVVDLRFVLSDTQRFSRCDCDCDCDCEFLARISLCVVILCCVS